MCMRNWRTGTNILTMRTTGTRTISPGTAANRTCIRIGTGRCHTPIRTIRTCTTGIRTNAGSDANQSTFAPNSVPAVISYLRTLLVLLLAAFPALAPDSDSIAVLDRRELAFERSAALPSHHLRLTLAYFEGGGWTPEAIHAAVRQSAQILGQCGLALQKAELVLIGAPDRFRDYYTPISRELVRALKLGKPAVYFVTGTRQRPAFDAEAIGRGNSRTRPELADSVWVALGTRDLGIALAHELAHVLMDSGEHSEEAGNLMREDTAPQNTSLSSVQCSRLLATASANGLLGPP